MNLHAPQPCRFDRRRAERAWQLGQRTYARIEQLISSYDGAGYSPGDVYLAAAEIIAELQASADATVRTVRWDRRRYYAPLTVGAAALYCALIGETERRGHTEEDLDGHLAAAARALSTAVPIYQLDGGQTLGIHKDDLLAIDKLTTMITDVRQADPWRRRFFIRP